MVLRVLHDAAGKHLTFYGMRGSRRSGADSPQRAGPLHHLALEDGSQIVLVTDFERSQQHQQRSFRRFVPHHSRQGRLALASGGAESHRPTWRRPGERGARQIELQLQFEDDRAIGVTGQQTHASKGELLGRPAPPQAHLASMTQGPEDVRGCNEPNLLGSSQALQRCQRRLLGGCAGHVQDHGLHEQIVSRRLRRRRMSKVWAARVHGGEQLVERFSIVGPRRPRHLGCRAAQRKPQCNGGNPKSMSSELHGRHNARRSRCIPPTYRTRPLARARRGHMSGRPSCGRRSLDTAGPWT